jgi:hypothetical protein
MNSPATLENRIRTLCAKAITAEGEEAEEVIEELKSALHKHDPRASKKLLAAYPLDST